MYCCVAPGTTTAVVPKLLSEFLFFYLLLPTKSQPTRLFLFCVYSPGPSLRLSLRPPALWRHSQVLALTASPAGELTVLDTVVRIEELLDRLAADLVAPLDCLEEVREGEKKKRRHSW